MFKARHLAMLFAALLLGVTSAGLGFAAISHASSSRAVSAAPTKKVFTREASNKYLFAPARTTVTKGIKVVWTNKTDAEHNVTFNNGPKVNKDFKPNKSVSYLFTKAGSYRYHCEYHPYMHGVVVVKK